MPIPRKSSAAKLATTQAESLSRPFWFLVTLISFLYVRWQAFVPILGVFRIPGFLTFGFIFWWLKNGDKSILTKEPILKCFMFFTALAGISYFYANNSVCVSLSRNLLFYLLSIVCPLIFIADNWFKVISFFRAWMVIHCIVAIYAVIHHGEGPGDFLLDENDLSLAFTMAIPYPFYLFFVRNNAPKWKALAIATLLLLMAGVFASFSRGGFLGMVTVIASFWLFSKRKLRNLGIGILIVAIFGGIAWNFVPEKYVARIESADDPNNDTRVERLHSWEIGWIMWKNNPIFGVGAGNFAWNVGNYERQTSYWIDDVRTKSLAGRQAHSLYFSMLPDMGLVGATAYAAMVVMTFRILFGVLKLESQPLKKRRSAASKPTDADDADANLTHDAALLARAMICSMIGFFISGAFISVAYYPHMWLLAGFAITLRNSVEVHIKNNTAVSVSGQRRFPRTTHEKSLSPNP